MALKPMAMNLIICFEYGAEANGNEFDYLF
jgi:hypothetical protein